MFYFTITSSMIMFKATTHHKVSHLNIKVLVYCAHFNPYGAIQCLEHLFSLHNADSAI